mgnify:CR=1 FL=1
MTRTRVAIAGSTGSIGTQTIDVVRAEPDRFVVTALAAGSSVDQLIEQATLLRPELVVVASAEARERVSAALPGMAVSGTLSDVVDVADVVINGVVGFAGLPVAMETLRRGKVLGLALANFVMFSSPEAIIFFGGMAKAGELLMKPTRETMEKNLLPIFQNKVKLIFSELKEADAAILGASALVWETK